jgi:hypothetical protein
MTTRDPDGDSALFEFAEEGDAPRRAWKRASFADRVAGEFAAEDAKEDTPILWEVPGQQRVSWWRWIGVAAGLAACAAIVVAIVMRSRVAPPTQSSDSAPPAQASDSAPPAQASDSVVPASSVPFVSLALPRKLSQVTPAVSLSQVTPALSRATPAVPLPTPDRIVTPPPSRVRVATAPASVPAPVKEESRPVETLAAVPAAPVSSPTAAVSSEPPVARPTVSEPPIASPRTEEPVRTPEPAAAASTAVARDESEIRDVLDAYRDSYVKRDVASTVKLWPGVDKAALSRAFATLASQQIDFAQCSLDVSGQRATARCSGSLQYVQRVGNGSPQLRSLLWNFDLDRSTGRWLISRVTAQ